MLKEKRTLTSGHALVLCFGLSLPLLVAGGPFTAPYEISTIQGRFTIPRTFAPIDVWKTVRVDPHESNYFVMRMTADYVAERVAGFSPHLNHTTQDVVIAVEALTDARRQTVIPSAQCTIATHDLEPLSAPYERCEYRVVLDNRFAVKLWLNGTNTRQLDAVTDLIHQLVEEWLEE